MAAQGRVAIDAWNDPTLKVIGEAHTRTDAEAGDD
jgi:hypothetical protein